MNFLLGSHGTGKSTLLQVLKKCREDIFTTDGVSRPVKRATARLLTTEKQQAIINELTEWNWINALEHKNYFCTRSVLDSIVYSKVLGWEKLAEKSRKVFEESDYSKAKFFYIPIEFELEDDGVRFTDLSFQRKVDQEMQWLIEDYDLQVITVTGSVEERIQIILNNL